MALVEEMIAEAMLGPVKIECHWLILTMNTKLYQEATSFKETAEQILSEIRTSPTLDGFDKVEIPGERERDHIKKSSKKGVSIPVKTWDQIKALAEQ